MRILAIAQRHDELARHRHAGGEFLPLVDIGHEPVGDHPVISGGGGIGLGGAEAAEIIGRRAAIGVHLRDEARIIGRVGHNRDALVILRGGADHRRAADVNILDDLVSGSALRHRLRERIEVDHHEVDRRNGVLRHRGDMLRIIPHREQPAMHLGMQRLDPPVHHFGKAGEIGDVVDGEPRFAQRLRGAAGRHQRHAVTGKRLPQLHKPRLVGHRKQRPPDYYVCHPSS
jgi:hypothetical protein